ncbi:MAG: penicillin-binding protein 2 [bacterium]
MSEDLQNKKLFYTIITLVLFAILLGRFTQLQIYNWDKYFSRSERNRIREVVIEPSRGLILDRHGEILVDNRPAYSVFVVPYEFLRADSSISLLSSIIKQKPSQIKHKIKKEQVGLFNSVKLKRHIGFQVLSAIEEYRLDLPGVLYGIESTRFYPAGIRAPHLFGYLGEITSRELLERKDEKYNLGDLIGKNGIELQYENYLRGESGVQYIEVDVFGREVRDLPELTGKSPVPGKNLYLTIDADIQRYLERVMKDKKGAAVILDPRNGEVLAMVSKPDYNPEIFSTPLTPEIWKQLVNHEDRPLYNRACQSLYPPGSTFKLILAAAGLEQGIIDPERKVFCAGTYRLGRRNFDCWKKGGHGEVNLLQALEQSCNVYFYTMSLEVGLENWSKFAKLFQFGKLTHLDLPNESAGLVPNKEYFDRKYGERGWTTGMLLNLAVGQGDLLVTPLQMAYLAMILANEGLAFKPHLVKKIETLSSGKFILTELDSLRVRGVSSDSFKKIKQGMYLVVNGSHGTAKAARLPEIKVCGKTGTAQNPHGEAHAWFIGFAPMENPVVAFCIFVENGGSGGAVAAPIARGVLSIIFSQ